VAQKSKLSSGAEAQYCLRLTWELKLPPPKERSKGTRDGSPAPHRFNPATGKQRWRPKGTLLQTRSKPSWALHGKGGMAYNLAHAGSRG
jgi:hypothetical protein